MKSFDEVIKALSICGRHPDCKRCPYENVSYPTEIGNTCKDIMHYDALYYMQDRSDECQEANSPLTWDELKQMEGKPVWVEETSFKQEWYNGYWLIVSQIDDEDEKIVFSPWEMQSKKYMGKTWKAYRKERNVNA